MTKKTKTLAAMRAIVTGNAARDSASGPEGDGARIVRACR